MLEPFPLAHLPELWEWLGQAPEHNFDDDGPRTLEALETEMTRRLAAGEYLFGVRDGNGRLVGAVGLQHVARHLAMFRGIVFDRAAHGTGIAAAAVRAVIDTAFALGVTKVCAVYFADNPQIHRFLAKLGATPEGYLQAHAMRGGSPVDMRLVAFLKGN